MKKFITPLAVIAVLFSISFISGCKKDQEEINTEGKAEISLKKEPGKPPTVNLIFCEVTLRRAVDKPGKRCSCFECFGLCDLVWFPSLKDLKTQLSSPLEDNNKAYTLFEIDFQNNKVIAYILSKKDYFENEFGIDLPLEFPKEALDNVNVNYVLLKEGLYKFQEDIEIIIYDEKEIMSYGKVVLDIEVR